MSKTIKISKESMDKFNHDKNVVGITQEELIECPINNQADLHADAMLENLFDNGEYLTYDEIGNGITHWAVGFIGGKAITCYYWLGQKCLIVKHNEILYEKSLEEFENMLVNRTTDEHVFSKLERTRNTRNYKEWVLRFYYKHEYAAEFLG